MSEREPEQEEQPDDATGADEPDAEVDVDVHGTPAPRPDALDSI